MKTRNSLVSNSSSSSFVLTTRQNLTIPEVVKAIYDNCFLIELIELFKWEKSLKYFQENFKKENLDIEEDRHTIAISFNNEEEVKQIIEHVNIECGLVCVWTGGTDSGVEPQSYLQLKLLENNIQYLCQGDGSIDIRDLEIRYELYSECHDDNLKVIKDIKKYFGDKEEK